MKEGPSSKQCELRTPFFTTELEVNGKSPHRADSTLLDDTATALTWLPQVVLKTGLMFDSAGEKNIAWARQSYLQSIKKGKAIQRTAESPKRSFQSTSIALLHSRIPTFPFWAEQENLPLNMNSLGRNPLPQNDWKGKLNQISVFYERKCFGLQNKHFSDLVNIYFRETQWKDLCCTIFPKVDKPPEYFGIDDFSHLWFVISLGFSLWAPDQIRWLFKIVPSVIAALEPKNRWMTSRLLGHIRAACRAKTHTQALKHTHRRFAMGQWSTVSRSRSRVRFNH